MTLNFINPAIAKAENDVRGYSKEKLIKLLAKAIVINEKLVRENKELKYKMKKIK